MVEKDTKTEAFHNSTGKNPGYTDSLDSGCRAAENHVHNGYTSWWFQPI